ncbi:iron-sulfur cluster repair protein YtfE [Hydrogenophaga sp. RWCD_12]|uniref:iron-sulfur cluster repair protein YtfE n=1 Tax=Hydrogenophaga sp. RWCD_12 TaxID=3391190 RepID=UPI003984AF7E
MNTTTVERPQAQQAIGQIAVNLPGATAIFRRLKLDFCCGGQVPLAQACASKGLDTDAVLAELARLQREDQAPDAQDAAALIDHILTRYHAVHREQLPELVRMARRVEAVHRDHPAVPVGLAALLENMEVELLEHMEKEEQVLFPAIESSAAGLGSPIGAMRGEHTAHGALLDQLAALTNDHTPPPGACNTWRALFAGTAQLTDDLISHIHLENNVLFPQVEARTAAPCN